MTDAVIEFAKWVICEGVFQAADLDGLSIQEKALELGLLTKTNYDPEKHGEDEYAKPGSDWYVFSNLLTQTNPSPAPEAQQEPVAWGVFYRGKIVAVSLHKGYHYTVPLYTRPSEQAVTEAMVEVAAKAVVAEWQKMVAETSPHMSPGDHARAFVSPGNYRLIRAALKAAMEAER